MTTQLDERGQYGLIAELAARMHECDFSLDKTALQKLVYFLQEVHGIDCGYEFTLYTYGPFSAQLLGDLDSTAAFRGVEVDYDPSIRGYRISPGPKSLAVRGFAEDFVEEHGDAIDEVVRNFGGLTAKQLELRATIVYVVREAKEAGVSSKTENTAKMVHDLKPHFQISEIKEAIKQLNAREYVTVH